MPKYLTKQDFLSLVTRKRYLSEEDFETDIMSKLPKLLMVDGNQVTNQFYTLGFDGPECNRADIVVESKEEVPHALLVVELKIDRFVGRSKFNNDQPDDFTRPANQLRKYCQNIKALYGVILTEERCLMYKFDFRELASNRESVDKIPFPADIEKEHGRFAIIDAMLHRTNDNYFIFAILAIIYALALTFVIAIRH